MLNVCDVFSRVFINLFIGVTCNGDSAFMLTLILKSLLYCYQDSLLNYSLLIRDQLYCNIVELLTGSLITCVYAFRIRSICNSKCSNDLTNTSPVNMILSLIYKT